MASSITLSTTSVDNNYITSNIPISALNTISSSYESYNIRELEQRIENLEEQLQLLRLNKNNSKYKIIIGE